MVYNDQLGSLNQLQLETSPKVHTILMTSMIIILMRYNFTMIQTWNSKNAQYLL